MNPSRGERRRSRSRSGELAESSRVVQEAARAGDGPLAEGPCFRASRASAPSPATCRARQRPASGLAWAVAAAGLPESTTPYTLRHSGLSWALASGHPGRRRREVRRNEPRDAREALPPPARRERGEREGTHGAFANRPVALSGSTTRTRLQIDATARVNELLLEFLAGSNRRSRWYCERCQARERRNPRAHGGFPSCARHDSNMRPLPPQGSALSPELRARGDRSLAASRCDPRGRERRPRARRPARSRARRRRPPGRARRSSRGLRPCRRARARRRRREARRPRAPALAACGSRGHGSAGVRSAPAPGSTPSRSRRHGASSPASAGSTRSSISRPKRGVPARTRSTSSSSAPIVGSNPSASSTSTAGTP